jgi:hypothetical protein
MEMAMQWHASSHDDECPVILRSLEPEEYYRLDALWCTLNSADRRRRFGAAVSDASIRNYCETLADKDAVVIGAFRSNRMDAVIEVFPLSPAWEEAEIAMTSRSDSRALLEELFRLAAQEAQRRGCATLIALLGDDCLGALPVLATLGDVELDDDLARVDISDDGRAVYEFTTQEPDLLAPIP